MTGRWVEDTEPTIEQQFRRDITRTLIGVRVWLLILAGIAVIGMNQ